MGRGRTFRIGPVGSLAVIVVGATLLSAGAASADDLTPPPVGAPAAAIAPADANNARGVDDANVDAEGGGYAPPAASANPTPYFSTREGFDAEGRMKPAFEAQLFLYLPAVDATIGLNRPPGTDITISRPRPTISDVVNHLSFAFTCDCSVRFGDWSAEVTVLYVATKQKTTLPPLPPALPPAQINSKVRVIYVSPGFGYRAFRNDRVSIDLRAGFTYAALNADAEFVAGQFAAAKSVTPSFIQPWMGERIDFYPTPRWRIENTAALTGIGDAGGWNVKLAVSYLFNRWVDATLGYRASETRRDPGALPNGALRNTRILLYGPVAALGVRF